MSLLFWKYRTSFIKPSWRSLFASHTNRVSRRPAHVSRATRARGAARRVESSKKEERKREKERERGWEREGEKAMDAMRRSTTSKYKYFLKRNKLHPCFIFLLYIHPSIPSLFFCLDMALCSMPAFKPSRCVWSCSPVRRAMADHRSTWRLHIYQALETATDFWKVNGHSPTKQKRKGPTYACTVTQSVHVSPSAFRRSSKYWNDTGGEHDKISFTHVYCT